MVTKTFSVVTLIAMLLTLTAALLSLIGITITGLYPGIAVLVLIAMIPLGSRYYAKRTAARGDGTHTHNFTPLMILNIVIILVVLWMTYVIVHDRVLQDCC